MAGRKRDGFYKRDGSPFWWTRDPRDGKRKSTECRDKEAARLKRAKWERMAADPAHAAAEAATLGEWCGRFVAWKERSAADATVKVARQKLGHWVRVFGADVPLARLSEPSSFDSYVTQRRGEKASDHTISKEVAHMLAVLKLAKRGKCFAGDLSTLRPPDLHAGYKPRERTLTRAELAALLSELEPHRAVWVAVGVALGCRLGEVSRMLPTDIDWAEERVLIRGTKTKASRRYLPILSLYRPLLEAAAPYLPVKPWGKIWRDIQAACKRARIAPCSTNDFRRTHATLLAEADVSPDVIRRLLGHTTDTLVKQVYARPSTKALGGLAESKLANAIPLLSPPGTTDSDVAIGSVGPEGLASTSRAAVGTEETSSGTAGAIPVQGGNLYAGVTFPYQTPTNDAETSIIPSAPGKSRTCDLRFRKPEPHRELDAGILGFPGNSAPWIPPDAGGFGRDSRGSDTRGSQ